MRLRAEKDRAQAGPGHARFQQAVLSVHAVQSLGGGQVAGKDDITIGLAPVLSRHGVGFSAAGAKRVYPLENRVELGDGSSMA
jgi:hypothetical protein